MKFKHLVLLQVEISVTWSQLLNWRVNYDEDNWNKIASALLTDHQTINRLNRAQILDDSLTLARAGLLRYPVALANTEYLTKEVDFIPWKAALNQLSYLDLMLGRTEDYEEFKTFMKQKLISLYNHLGFESKASP